MNTKDHWIASHYVTTALSAARRKGYDADTLMLDAGISADALTQAGSRISPEKVTALIQSIWQTRDDEFMGFTDQACKQGVFAIMANQVIACSTLREVLVKAAHFYHHIRNDIVFIFDEKCEEKAQEAVLSFELRDPSLDPDHFLVEFFLLIWHRFSSWLVGQRVPLKYANFVYASPPHVKEYALLFPCHCRFNQTTNSIVFDAESLNLQVKQHERELRRVLKKYPADLLSKPVFYTGLTTQVMNLIGESDNQAFPLIDEVASYFHMSARHLRRRLKEEGTSYQGIKDTLRQDRAKSLLHKSDIAISQISREVGFNEPAAFTRAFKKWTGLSPRGYRELNRM